MTRFPGTCRDCGAHVALGEGNFHRANGRFDVRCRACINEFKAVQSANPQASYRDWKPAKRTPKEDGER
jgi:hypothetical protein